MNGNQTSQNTQEEESVISEISELILSNFFSEAGKSLDEVESEFTKILTKVRSKTTQDYFENQDRKECICNECNEKMRIREKQSRKVVGLSPYHFKKRVFYCPRCKSSQSPLEGILKLHGKFSLEVRKSMLLLGQRLPFLESSDYLKRLIGVDVSDQSIRSLVEGVGQKIADEDQRSVRKFIDNADGIQQSSQETRNKKKGAAYLELDGMMVQTREEGWKEIRNGILFSGNKNLRMDQHHKKIQEKICFGIFNQSQGSLEDFKNRATFESHQFQFDDYEKSVIIGDGANWIWDYAAKNHPKAIQILDYYHASEYLGNALKSIESLADYKKRRTQELWEGKVEVVLLHLKSLKQTKEVSDCIRYFTKHQDRMKYQEYREQGLDIGSGAIESTHRTLVQSRMKLAGMHWKKENVQSIVSLKSRYHSGRWDEVTKHYLQAA